MGSIITFYSYKGGTGRSMALANIGVLLSRSNRKTLLIDWDLEAPGLHRYFDGLFQSKSVELKPGLIDYFSEIQSRINDSKLNSDETQIILNNIKLEDYVIETSIPNLSLLKAGAFDDKYPERINTLKWENLFRNADGLFSCFRDLLKSRYDYVLIDSRTGYTDSSGICSMILPEKVVLVFTPNSQSLNGVVELMKRASDYRLRSSDLRPLLFYPLPSRIENAEKELRERWRNGKSGYQPSFEKAFSEIYAIPKIDLTHYLNEVQIQHEPKFAYGEEIAVLKERSKDRLSLSESYNKFLNHLIGNEEIWSVKSKNESKIYFSFEEEMKPFAQGLIKDLRSKGIAIPQTDANYAFESYSPSNFSKEISEADIIIPIISDQYINSRFSKLEMSMFIEQKRLNSKKRLIPILVTTKEKFYKLPSDISNGAFIEGRDRSISRVSRLVYSSVTGIELSSPKKNVPQKNKLK